MAALAQNGLSYASNPFDIDRYQAIRKIAAAILAEHTLADPQRIEDLFAEEAGYATPKVDVRGVVFREQALLLVKEREDGRWTCPAAGPTSTNRRAKPSCARSLRSRATTPGRPNCWPSSTGGSIRIVPLLPFHIYKLFIRCEWLGGEPTISSETEAVGFFREDQLPELPIPAPLPPNCPHVRALAAARFTRGF